MVTYLLTEKKRKEKNYMKKTMQNVTMFYTAADLASILGVSLSKGYLLIKQMNHELEEQGYMTISARVPKRYFEKRWYGYCEN